MEGSSRFRGMARVALVVATVLLLNFKLLEGKRELREATLAPTPMPTPTADPMVGGDSILTGEICSVSSSFLPALVQVHRNGRLYVRRHTAALKES